MPAESAQHRILAPTPRSQRRAESEHGLEAVLQPRVLALRRLVIAEAERFPELGQAFFDQGPGRTVDALATRLATLTQEGLLRIDDPRSAATDFNGSSSQHLSTRQFGRTSFPHTDLAHVAKRA